MTNPVRVPPPILEMVKVRSALDPMLTMPKPRLLVLILRMGFCTPVPKNVTVLVPVKVALLDTVAELEKLPALVGQNWTVKVAAEPFDTEKLLPEKMLNGGFGEMTVPEAGPAPRTCWMTKEAVLQLPTWTLPKFNEEGPTVIWPGEGKGEVETTLTSSMRKAVGRLPSVVPRKFTRTVCPMNGIMSNNL